MNKSVFVIICLLATTVFAEGLTFTKRAIGNHDVYEGTMYSMLSSETPDSCSIGYEFVFLAQKNDDQDRFSWADGAYRSGKLVATPFFLTPDLCGLKDPYEQDIVADLYRTSARSMGDYARLAGVSTANPAELIRLEISSGPHAEPTIFRLSFGKKSFGTTTMTN